MKSLYVKVAGVTFEGRQEILATMHAGMPVQIKPEPENKYDHNALAVYVGIGWENVPRIGYIPRELAEIIAPFLDGEALIGKVAEMTGGFEKWDGSRASLGCVVRVELPDEADI